MPLRATSSDGVGDACKEFNDLESLASVLAGTARTPQDIKVRGKRDFEIADPMQQPSSCFLSTGPRARLRNPRTNFRWNGRITGQSQCAGSDGGELDPECHIGRKRRRIANLGTADRPLVVS